MRTASLLAFLVFFSSGCDNISLVSTKDLSSIQRDLQEIRQELDALKNKQTRPEKRFARYEIVNMSIASGMNVPIIYDKETGQAWRYFIENEKESNNFGFTPLIYNLFESTGITPQIANEAYIKNGGK